MLKYLFTKRFFMSTLGVFILFVTGCLLYMRHVDKQTQQEIERITEQIKQWEAAQKHAEKAPVEETAQGGHSHGDERHAEPHEPPTTQVSNPPDTSTLATETLTKDMQNVWQSSPLGFITFEEYAQQIVEWENLPRDDWGIARKHDGKLALFPKPPGSAGKWHSLEEYEKAGDLWWEKYQKKVKASQERFRLLNERSRQLGGRPR